MNSIKSSRSSPADYRLAWNNWQDRACDDSSPESFSNVHGFTLTAAELENTKRLYLVLEVYSHLQTVDSLAFFVNGLMRDKIYKKFMKLHKRDIRQTIFDISQYPIDDQVGYIHLLLLERNLVPVIIDSVGKKGVAPMSLIDSWLAKRIKPVHYKYAKIKSTLSNRTLELAEDFSKLEQHSETKLAPNALPAYKTKLKNMIFTFLFISAYHYGQERVTNFIERATSESFVGSFRDYIQILENWENIGDYPLDWACRII